MPLGHDELVRRENDRLQVRREPVRAGWKFAGLASADRHELTVEFCCRIQVEDRPAERQMLAETFLGAAPAVTVSDVEAHFRQALHDRALSVCRAVDVDHLLGDAGKASLREALLNEAERRGFSCGLKAMAPCEIHVSSPSVERARREQMQRRLAEEQAAGRLEHIKRAKELLAQFEELRAANRRLDPGEVLKLLNHADQADVLRISLLAAAGDGPAAPAWAVSGRSLLRIDLADREPSVVSLDLPPHDLGPFRSVSTNGADGTLLLGARDGVIVASVHPAVSIQPYAADVRSPLGFNRVVRWGGEIWASHSAAGIVAWKADAPQRPFFVAEPASLGGSPRNITVIDERLLVFSVGNRLWTLSRESPDAEVRQSAGPQLKAEVTSMVRHADRLIVALADRSLQTWTCGPIELASETVALSRPASLGVVPWLDSMRLLMATAEGTLLAIGLADGLVTQYAADRRAGHAVAAARHAIAAVSADRDWIVVWWPWDHTRPVAQLRIAAITRHRTADVTF